MDNNSSKSEVRKIVSFEKSNKTITLNESLAFNHTDENVAAIVINMDRNVELSGKKRGLGEKSEMEGMEEEENAVIINEGTYKQGMKMNIKDTSIKKLGGRQQPSI